MPLKTTVIGAYPKPAYLPLGDWFKMAGQPFSVATRGYEDDLAAMGEEAESLFMRATQEVIDDQIEAGIDVVTDGEVRRENYIYYHCRHLDGFDFDKLVEKSLREGAIRTELPAIVAPISAREPFMAKDWKKAQACSSKPVKVTLPGPLTTADTTVDLYYDDLQTLGQDFAEALNHEILDLVAQGCTNIQIDEPVFARQPARALDFGIENLERCWRNVPSSVTKTVHICCGYPNKLDEEDYPKADRSAYSDLASALDDSSVDEISLEDAHRNNDLRLLELFQHSRVIFGAIAIARSKLEKAEEIRQRLALALEHIDKDRLMVAPDCGLGYLPRDLARAKLTAMCEAARSF